jgi:hypothetical protein
MDTEGTLWRPTAEQLDEIEIAALPHHYSPFDPDASREKSFVDPAKKLKLSRCEYAILL